MRRWRATYAIVEDWRQSAAKAAAGDDVVGQDASAAGGAGVGATAGAGAGVCAVVGAADADEGEAAGVAAADAAVAVDTASSVDSAAVVAESGNSAGTVAGGLAAKERRWTRSFASESGRTRQGRLPWEIPSCLAH